MARKNIVNKKEADFVFDSRTNRVMAQSLPHEGIKEKIQSVRDLVPNPGSNNDIVLVLQYYDYNIEAAISAYLENGAAEARKEWNISGKQKKQKKKNRKRKPREESAPSEISFGSSIQDLSVSGIAEGSTISDSSVDVTKLDITTVKTAANETPLSVIVNHNDNIQLSDVANVNSPCLSSPDEDHSTFSAVKSVDSQSLVISDNNSASSRSFDQMPSGGTRPKVLQASPASHVEDQYEHAVASESSHHKHKKIGLEKSLKDLYRQVVSISRHKTLLSEEIDHSYKKIKEVSDVIRTKLDEREVDLIIEMDKVKKQAMELMDERQQQADALTVRTRRIDGMSEASVLELKADIKHFVSERKLEEDLCRTTRFIRNEDPLIEVIKTFGEVIPAKNHFTHRRASVSSVASSMVSHDEIPTPVTPISPMPPSHSNAPPTTKQNAKQSTSDLAELQQRLHQALKLQGVKVEDTKPASVQTYKPNRPYKDHDQVYGKRGSYQSRDERQGNATRGSFQTRRGGQSRQSNYRGNETYNRPAGRGARGRDNRRYRNDRQPASEYSGKPNIDQVQPNSNKNPNVQIEQKSSGRQQSVKSTGDATSTKEKDPRISPDNSSLENQRAVDRVNSNSQVENTVPTKEKLHNASPKNIKVNCDPALNNIANKVASLTITSRDNEKGKTDEPGGDFKLVEEPLPTLHLNGVSWGDAMELEDSMETFDNNMNSTKHNSAKPQRRIRNKRNYNSRNPISQQNIEDVKISNCIGKLDH